MVVGQNAGARKIESSPVDEAAGAFASWKYDVARGLLHVIILLRRDIGGGR